MHRILALLILGFIAVGIARADLPPPAGSKRAQLDHKITTEKEYPDWVFFTLVGGSDKGKGGKGAETGKGVTQVKLDTKTPILLSGEGRTGIGRQGQLAAVPKETVKKYATEKELLIAVRDRSAPGLIRCKMNLDSTTTIKESDPRKIVVTEMVIEKLDAKDGIVLKAVKAKDDPKKEPPSANVVVAGLAGSLAVAFSGIWLTRRYRTRRAGQRPAL